MRVASRVTYMGKNLLSDEDGSAGRDGADAAGMETARTRFMQYGYNVTQLLAQLLHNEDHVAPFVAANGFDALLDLARWAVTPGGRPLVAHVSCLSNSVASATHSTTSTTLSVLVKKVIR